MLTARVNYLSQDMPSVKFAGPLAARHWVCAATSGMEITNTDNTNTPLASTHAKARRTSSPSGNSSLWVRRKVSCDDNKFP